MAGPNEVLFPVAPSDDFAVLINKITQLSIESGIKIAQNLFPPTDDTVSEAGRPTRGRKLPDFKKKKPSRSSSVPTKVYSLLFFHIHDAYIRCRSRPELPQNAARRYVTCSPIFLTSKMTLSFFVRFHLVVTKVIRLNLPRSTEPHP